MIIHPSISTLDADFEFGTLAERTSKQPGKPGNKMKLVQAWIEIHRDELVADWELAVSGQQPYKIEPLR